MKKCRTAFSRVKWLRRTSIVDNWIPFFWEGRRVKIYAQLPVTFTRAIAYKHIMCTLSLHSSLKMDRKDFTVMYFLCVCVCVCHEHPRETFDRNFLVVAKFFFYFLLLFCLWSMGHYSINGAWFSRVNFHVFSISIHTPLPSSPK